MRKIAKCIRVCLIISAFIHCTSLSLPVDQVSTIKIKDASKEQFTMVPLKREHFFWGIRITKNTLNDTARIGIVPVPPGFTGSLFTIDNASDSAQILIPYLPYKATKGELILKCYSSNF